MSLFPAYSTETSPDNESLFPSFSVQSEKATGNVGSNWLSNTSFAPDKKIVAFSSLSPIQLSSDSSIIEIEQKPRKRKNKKTHREKKHKRDRDLKLKKVERPKPVPTTTSVPKWEFVSKKLGRISGDIFMTDRRRDLENLQFNSVYKRQIAKFNYSRGKLSLLEGAFHLHKELFGLKKQKNLRYYSLKLRKRKRKDPDTMIAVSKVRIPDYLFEDHVELTDQKPVFDPDGKELVYDASIQMYRNKEETEEKDVYIRSEEEKEKLRIQEGLHKNPHDIALWNEFLILQDKLSGSAKTDLALLERKMAILDKAIAANPSSCELKILRIRVGKDGLWEPKQIKQEWSKLEFTHVNQPEIWREQLRFYLSNFSAFKVGRLLALFDRAIEKFSAVVEGKMLTHKPPPHAEEFLLELFLWKVSFLAECGFMEKAVACFQACIEFNFTQDFAKATKEEKKYWFETFWSSVSTPKIGEANAQGWTVQFSSSAQLQNDEDLNEVENEITAKYRDSDGELWMNIERLRCDKHWRPWKSKDNDPEDPDRAVLFDDIKSSLLELRKSDCKFVLLISFLKLLGANLLPFNACSAWLGSFGERNLLKIFTTLPTLTSPSFSGVSDVIENAFATIEAKFYPEEPYRTYFTCSRLHHTACEIQKTENVSEKEKLKRFKSEAKEVLKADRNRNCLLLYAVYARELATFPHHSALKEGSTVAKTALKMAETLLQATADTEHEDSTPSAIVQLMKLVVKGMAEDLGRMSAYLASFFTTGASVDVESRCEISASDLLRAKKFAEEKLQSFRADFKPESRFCSSSYTGSILVHITELCAWFYYASRKGIIAEAKQVFDDSAQVIREELEKHSDANSREFHALSIDLELLLEAKHDLIVHYVEHSPLASMKQLRESLEESVQVIPCKAEFWNQLVTLNTQGFKMIQLRRLFGHFFSKGSNLPAELGLLRAEFDRFFWLVESQDGEKLPQVHSLRRAFEAAVRRFPNSALIWRLYLQLECLAKSGTERKKQVFYPAVRNCPWSKDLYMDFIQACPSEVEMIIDLLIEKEMRIRIPPEELELLREAVSQDSST